MRILLADDDKTFCDFLKELLRAKGYDVDATTRGLEAYKMSQRKFYDLFIFDVRMPFLTGVELAEGLKQQSPTARIILFSAFLDDRLQNSARQIGAPILSKPFNTDKFLDLVSTTTSH
jgi:DNA-binding response OmpR family regulator